jgi:hypothetical protein
MKILGDHEEEMTLNKEVETEALLQYCNAP